jgi:hypothetical protein
LRLNPAGATEKSDSLFHAEHTPTSPTFFDIGNLGDIEPLTIIVNPYPKLVALAFENHSGVLCSRVLSNVAYGSLEKAKEPCLNLRGQAPLQFLGLYLDIDTQGAKVSLSVLTDGRYQSQRIQQSRTEVSNQPPYLLMYLD